MPHVKKSLRELRLRLLWKRSCRPQATEDLTRRVRTVVQPCFRKTMIYCNRPAIFPPTQSSRKTVFVLGFRACFAIGRVKSSVALAGGRQLLFQRSLCAIPTTASLTKLISVQSGAPQAYLSLSHPLGKSSGATKRYLLSFSSSNHACISSLLPCCRIRHSIFAITRFFTSKPTGQIV